MKLIFEYEQADGQIDGLAAKAAFEAALNTAGWRCELDKAKSQTVMRVAPIDVTMDNFRIQQTMCSLTLTFAEETAKVAGDAGEPINQAWLEGMADRVRAGAVTEDMLRQSGNVPKRVIQAVNKAAMTRPSPDPDIAQEPGEQPPSGPASEDGPRNTRRGGRGAR